MRTPFQKPQFEELLRNPDEYLKLMRAEIEDEAFTSLIRKAQTQYMPWEKFRYQPPPQEISIENAWRILIHKRLTSAERSPLSSERGKRFRYSITNEHIRMLRLIDSQASGSYVTDVQLPEGSQQAHYVLNGLLEEAINSSQLEGASTTRKVAKAMITEGREPTTDSEKMILNNYLAMQRIQEWSSRPLSEPMLLELHHILTEDILPPDEAGQFRKDSDEVVVSDPVTNEIFHRAPPVEFLKEELKKLYAFANAADEYHPVIKAIFLHFWIGYLHPFTDGNGRTARILFYWYLLKNDYWLFNYVSASRTIKASKKSYGSAYVLSEQHDELDLGYFVQYILKSTLLSIEDFKIYLKRKKNEEEKVRDRFQHLDLNDRQRDAINHLSKTQSDFTIGQYQSRYRLVYETARKDLAELEDHKLMAKRKSGKKFIYQLAKV